MPNLVDTRPIRQRLNEWKPSGGQEWRTQQLVPDMSFYSRVTNSNTRPQSTGSSEMDHFKSDNMGMAEVPDGPQEEDAEVAIVGSNTRTPGDLVEMKYAPPVHALDRI